MEKTLLKIMLAATVWFVYSSLASAKVDDFDRLIQDSQQNTKELHQQLQKGAGLVFDQSKPGSIAKEKLQAPKEAEQVVVSSSREIIPAREKIEKMTDKKDMNRLSQEIKDLQD